jgi:repressor LexA
MKRISDKHMQIYEFIKSFTSENGYPPSVREIGFAVGLRSPSTVHSHLKTLRDLGYITREEHKTRAISISGPDAQSSVYTQIPILGTVAAGEPAYAYEEIEGYLPYDVGGAHKDYFALRVRGKSMIGAGILPGDVVVVRRQPDANSGEIVVAIFEDEATVKRLKRKGKEIWLMPENPEFEPINGTFCRILGRVCAVIREYE